MGLEEDLDMSKKMPWTWNMNKICLTTHTVAGVNHFF